MLHRILLTLACLLAAACVDSRGSEQDAERTPVPPNINERFVDPDLDADAWIERWEVESREIYASRRAIVDAIDLRQGAAVADVGAGTGLFVELFSEAVTDTGTVYAVEISPRFVEYIRQRAEDTGLTNVEAVLSAPDTTRLFVNSVDVVFTCDTYHHFEYHEAMLRSIHAALRPGGQFVVVDFERVPGKSREWILDHVRAGKDVFRMEIEQAGFRFVEEVTIPGFQENYFLRFEKVSTP